jgi:hypothetical protein
MKQQTISTFFTSLSNPSHETNGLSQFKRVDYSTNVNNNNAYSFLFRFNSVLSKRRMLFEKLTYFSFLSNEPNNEKLSSEDMAKIQRNRVAAMVRHFAHYLKEPQWKERLQSGTHLFLIHSLIQSFTLYLNVDVSIDFALGLNNVESFLRITSSR